MIRWAIGFFVIALLAALLGFTGVAIAFAGIAKILFYIFIVLFVITLAGHLFRGAENWLEPTRSHSMSGKTVLAIVSR